MKQFHAIDLFALLNALPREQVGEGAYIILTNVRGERQVWQRKQIEAYKPVIVIGIDDEKNLFRFSTFLPNVPQVFLKVRGADYR